MTPRNNQVGLNQAILRAIQQEYLGQSRNLENLCRDTVLHVYYYEVVLHHVETTLFHEYVMVNPLIHPASFQLKIRHNCLSSCPEERMVQ